MAKKDEGVKTLLIVGGVLGGVYLLSRTDSLDKLKALMSMLPQQSGGGIGIDLGGLGTPALDWASIFSQFPQQDCNIPNIPKLPTLPDLFNGGGGGDEGGATVIDLAYSLPAWAKGALAVGAVGIGAVGAYGGYKVIKASGPVLRAAGELGAVSVNAAGRVIQGITNRVGTRLAGQVVKSAPLVASKVITGAATKITGKVAAAAAPNIIGTVASRVTPRIAGGIGTRILSRVLPAAGVKVATRAIPIIGWGMLLADLGADISRLFGAKPPEFMGFLPLIEAITGHSVIGAASYDVATQTTATRVVAIPSFSSTATKDKTIAAKTAPKAVPMAGGNRPQYQITPTPMAGGTRPQYQLR